MTGREVTLTLAIPDPKGGPPTVEEVCVYLLPVSQQKKSRGFREAEAYIAQCEKEAADAGLVSRAPSPTDERALRFLCEAMRDNEDRRKYFVETDKIDSFRDIIIDEQVRLLLAEYDELILAEYLEIRTRAEALRIKAEAKQVFTSGQG